MPVSRHLFRSTALAIALLAGRAATAQSYPAGPQQVPPTAPPTTNDPALNGRGEPPVGRDPAAAFSPGNVQAPPSQQSATLPFITALQRDNPIGNAIRALRNKGVALGGSYVGNLAGNPVGGVSHGFVESHWIDFTADLDLDKLIGLSKTRIHARGADFEGDNLAALYVGSSISFQQTWRPVPGWRLTQLDIEHDFGKLNVDVGRSALNTYFGSSPLNCVFMSNTACLTAYGPITAIGITAFPNSSWMGKLRYAFSKKVYAQVGVFDYNNALNAAGVGGTDFSFFQGSGKLIGVEAGYETTFATDRYPRRYKLGIDINTDPGTSPLYDRNGRPAGISGLARAAQTGTRVGLYALVDQTISRPDPHSPRNLAVFGRAFYNAGATSVIDAFASVGFVKTGTFRHRDNDSVGFLVSDTRFSDDEIEYLRELRVKGGGSGTPHRDEIIGELNYGFAAAPGLRLLPNIQWEIHPDPINATRYPRDIDNALVLGLRIDVRFAQFFTGSN